MLITDTENLLRGFYFENEDDMEQKELLEQIGYEFVEFHTVDRKYPVYYIIRYKEKS